MSINNDVFKNDKALTPKELNEIKESNEAQFIQDSLKTIQVKNLKAGQMVIGDEVFDSSDYRPIKSEKVVQKRKPSKEELFVIKELARIKKLIEAKNGR